MKFKHVCFVLYIAIEVITEDKHYIVYWGSLTNGSWLIVWEILIIYHNQNHSFFVGKSAATPRRLFAL